MRYKENKAKLLSVILCGKWNVLRKEYQTKSKYT